MLSRNLKALFFRWGQWETYSEEIETWRGEKSRLKAWQILKPTLAKYMSKEDAKIVIHLTEKLYQEEM